MKETIQTHNSFQFYFSTIETLIHSLKETSKPFFQFYFSTIETILGFSP